MRFFHLVLVAFVFIVSCALALSSDGSSALSLGLSSPEKQMPSLPVLSETSAFPVISAQASVAVDLASGIILYEKNPDNPLLPASTTKIITALVALDSYPLQRVVKVGKVGVEGQKMGLVSGEEITVEDLLWGLLVYSANDAAEALAENYPGGRDAFIGAMNEKARELSLEHSVFSNPTGLDGNGHTTTARDLIRVSEIAMTNPVFADMVSTKERVVRSADGRVVHNLRNINALLGKVDGVMGVKTGWTQNARENLVTYIERDGKKVMIALLGSQDRFGETQELIEWIFANYEWKKVSYPE